MNSAAGLLGLNPGASKDERKQAVMREIQQQQNIQNAQMLIEKVNVNCFEKCVPKPGSSLSNGESVSTTRDPRRVVGGLSRS